MKTKPCWKVALVGLTFGVVLYCLPSILPGENDVIAPDEHPAYDSDEFPVAEDTSASSDILTITTYTGHMEAHLITFPDGTTMSIDCGYQYGNEDTITTISHFHVDHCGDCGDGPYPTYQYHRNNVVPGDVIYSDDDRNIIVTVVAANGAVIGQEPAGPYACASGYENGRSMALLVKYRGFDYLTAGDMYGETESPLGIALKERGIHIDVHKVSHHGSSTSTPLNFLLNVLPEYAVIAGGGSEPAGGILWKLVYAGVETIYYAHSYPVPPGYPICVATNGAVTTTTDGYTYSISGGSCGDYDIDVDETPTPTPTITPTLTVTPTVTPTPTASGAPSATPTAVIPSLVVLPAPLVAGQNFSVYLALTEDITQPFDFYFFVDTPAGPYTLYLDGKIKKGITPLYENVNSFTKDCATMVGPTVKIPAGMMGQAVTFYAVVVQAGKMPLVRRVSDLAPDTLNVILMSQAQAMVGVQNPE